MPTEPRHARIAEYYAVLTDRYLSYGGTSLGWHFGLWDETTQTPDESLARSNAVLVEDCALERGMRVLDAGCGIGGLSLDLAARFGVTVVGITLCEPHVELATRFARERGLADRVEFRLMNFEELTFDDAAFDVVLNQETLCYAADKEAYLHGVFRVLSPGGRWAAVDGWLGEAPLTDAASLLHEQAQRGWRTAPLARCRDVLQAAERAGFTGVERRDLSAMAAPTARGLVDQNFMHLLKRKVGAVAADELFDDHMAASSAFSEALLQGAFTYERVAGRKPG